MKFKIIGLICLISLISSTEAVELAKKKGKAKKSKEAKEITKNAKEGLAELEKDDASVSDMLSFSKAVASGKTAAEAVTDEENKAKEFAELQKLVQKEKEERDKLINSKTEFEIEEEQAKQHAIDITERKMLAKQYAQQMIDDDKRDGNDAGASNFQVIAD